MKILTAKQQHELDQMTMENEPISSIDLMERASVAFTEEMIKHCEGVQSVAVVCGIGNNGGDGLAIARLLNSKGLKVAVYFIALRDKGVENVEINRKRLAETSVRFVTLSAPEDVDAIDFSEDLIVDAIFGTGLSRSAEGIAKDVINKVNNSTSKIFSVDVPSGMYCDSPNKKEDAIVKATRTFTFHSPKLAYFFAEQGVYCGEVETLDIGLDKVAALQMNSPYTLISLEMLESMRKKRTKFSHKGTYGHAAIIAGSYEKMGAALLSVEACLHVGAGLTTAIIPESGRLALNVRTPSAMLEFSGEKQCEEILYQPDLTYAIGPGLGMAEQTKQAINKFIEEVDKPLVIDADALNILAKDKDLFSNVPANSILTPHPKEFERLTQSFGDSYERTTLQVELAKKLNVLVVLKDTCTVIATPDGQLFINTFGSVGMAKGGSGDVLTGIIAGLLAQGYSSLNAAIFGVGLHALAGEAAEKRFGIESMTADQISQCISLAFQRID
jgi:NAD(P)H-hydrate epimerase